MDFAIQVSNPRTTCSVSESDSTVGEAIETIFPLNTEFLIVIWNDVYVPLTYKYDVSVIIDDVLNLVRRIRDLAEGRMAIVWPSSTFRSRWDLTWTSTSVSIRSHWESVIGGTESLLNSKPTLELGKSAFLSEWVVMLRRVHRCLQERSVGVNISFDLSVIGSVLDVVPENGQLYVD